MILYIDCSAGAGGDMLLAALLDIGFPLSSLHQVARQLGFSNLRIQSRRIRRSGISAAQLVIHAAEKEQLLPREIGSLIHFVGESRLTPLLKKSLIRTIAVLGRAEGKVHGRPWRKAVLHQLASIDTMICLAGFIAGLNYLQVDQFYVSRVPLGSRYQDHSGKWRSIAGPTTRRLLQGFSIEERPDRFEWTTPTAAVLLAAWASPGSAPPIRIEKMSHAVGGLTPPAEPLALRTLLGAAYLKNHVALDRTL